MAFRRKRCRVCGADLPEVAVAHEDPYCSMQCCREDHGIPLQTNSTVSTSSSRTSMTSRKGKRGDG